MIDRKFGFRLRPTVDFSTQLEIIERMSDHGIPHPLIHREGEPTCMKILPCRVFDPRDQRAYQRELYEAITSEYDVDDYIYINRANPEVCWQWNSDPVSVLVRQEVEKILPLYEFIGRVSVLVTDVNTTVPFHKEWMYGNIYPDKEIPSSAYFQNKSLPVKNYEPEIKPDFHQQQGYYACKIPLTTREGQNGNSCLEFDDGRIVRYAPGNHIFCLNEIDMKHGVLPTEFLRGVIYIDGKLKLEELNNFFHSEFEAL